jgi:hypothetical protein
MLGQRQQQLGALCAQLRSPEIAGHTFGRSTALTTSIAIRRFFVPLVSTSSSDSDHVPQQDRRK